MKAEFVRGCGHTETLDVDTKHPRFTEKIQCIARTRCAACVKAITDRQAQEAANRRERKHKAAMEGHKRALEHRALEQKYIATDTSLLGSDNITVLSFVRTDSLPCVSIHIGEFLKIIPAEHAAMLGNTLIQQAEVATNFLKPKPE